MCGAVERRMKVLFNNHMPFCLAHGGAQVQIEQTEAALKRVGVEVEPLRWWDDRQRGEVLHHFGRMPLNLLRAARQKGMKTVFSDLLTETGSRSSWRLRVQKTGEWVMRRVLPRQTVEALRWDSYREADACVALTAWEAHLMMDLFRAPRERVHVVPNGVEEVFRSGEGRTRGQWLVCTATITERKRVLELAEAAAAARTPLWVIGSPYAESDAYGRRFVQFARGHSDLIRYEGAIADRARLAQVYREARGFALLSTMESLSLSALEAAACGCPLLLGDLPWATWTFKDKATYCPADGAVKVRAGVLRAFYDRAPELPVPSMPLSWGEVAEQLRGIYERLAP
jgi:glycosyltransferase involved in cell wall biosynthesis